MATRTRNKTVEIYFILYLAALVFLIPGKDKDLSDNQKGNLNPTRIFQLPFSLKPEKNALIATVKLDSTGMSIANIDSVNTIFYTGMVKDIKFEVSIEDRTSRQVLTIDGENNQQNLFFRFYTDRNTQTLKFIWNPPLYNRMDKTYIVKVSAQAVSGESATEGQIIEDIVQFSLILNYISDFESNLIIASDNSLNNQIINSDTTFQEFRNNYIAPANLFMTPREEIIKSLAYGSWENEISIFGLDPKFDLRKQPDIKLIREPDSRIGGSAKIVGFTPTSIILNGETPGYGTLKVAVSLTRHSDGKEAIREFRVMPQMIEDPVFDQILYPGIKYSFDPKLPVLSSQRTLATLKTSEGRLVSASNNGSKFEFTPSLIDTGKIIYFERFIDNTLVGQRYSIRVQMYPQPEISRISETGKNTVRIFTNCYGYHQGNQNYITKIEVLQGNAKVREIIGAQKNDEGKIVFRQVFEIVPSNPGNDFNFKIQATSLNGQKSDPAVYPIR